MPRKIIALRLPGRFALDAAKQAHGWHCGTDLNGVLLEGEYRFQPWTLFARGEWEQNNELDALGRTDRVSELTIGAIHDLPMAAHLKWGLGALYAFDFMPSSVLPSYGDNPHGFMAFVRLATR